MIPYQPQLLTVDGGQWRPNAELAPNCPRCDSYNTKFCYYNNYSLSQPRYFCKACRRYWTKGGALRNVPVGGGCRKKRRTAAKSQRQLANINHHQTPQNSLRPDLVLDGMSSSASDSSASDASAGIDMAELYAKYLNPATTDHEANMGEKCEGFVAETLATDQANFSVGDQLELVDGARIDQFFGSSNCTGDLAMTWPGPGDGFGIVDDLISYQSVLMGSEYWNTCSQFSSLDAMYSA